MTIGADAAVGLGEHDDLASAFADAAQGRIDVVIDPLFGEPFAAAVDAASFRARLVHLGQSAGAQATLSSGSIRGKLLAILGHSSFGAPPEVKRDGYARLAGAAAGAEIVVGVRPLALDRVGEAWELLQKGAQEKLVLVP